MKNNFRNLLLGALLALAGVLPITAGAVPFSSVIVFGDSISDSGNNAFVSDFFGFPTFPRGARTPTPVANQMFVPTLPYASSNRYSNGPVWVEQLAATLGLSAKPSLSGGTNYAFGGARTGPLNSPFPFSLVDQVHMFLDPNGQVASPSSLYVVAGGGNDARDAFTIAIGGGDPSALIAAYAANIASILTTLDAAGANDILLTNVPDIGKLPAVQFFGQGAAAAATNVSAAFNAALAATLASLPLNVRDDVHVLDLFGLLDQVFADPGAFGFTDVTSACAVNPACIANPQGTFFWDGIHATSGGQALLAQAALTALVALPEPGTLLLIGLGVVALRLRRSMVA
jgi:outer membrane lipase/esterase